MRIKKIWIIGILILTLLPFIQLFLTQDLPHTHDGGVQIPRIAAYVKSLREGTFPVRWAGDLNYGYGIPLFNFMYPLPYLIASFFVLSGSSLIFAFKMTLLLSLTSSAIAMYAFIKSLKLSSKIAFFVTILYSFNSFHLQEIFTRGAIGGIFTYTFFPLTLYSINKFIEKRSFITTLIIPMSIALLILSHNSLSLIFFLLSCIYPLFKSLNIKTTFFIWLYILLGLCIASFYWLPALYEHKFTYGDLYMTSLWQEHFPRFNNIISINQFNKFDNRFAGLSLQIDLILLLGLILALTLFIQKKLTTIEKSNFLFLFLPIIFCTFLLTQYSTYIWQNFSMLRQFQFPWRLLSVITFLLSSISIFIFKFKFFNYKIVYWTLILLFITFSYPYWTPFEGYDTVENEKIFWNDPRTTTYWGETDVIWTEGQAKEYPTERISVIGGKAEISNIIRSTTSYTLTINAFTDTQIALKTVYFPGWKVYSSEQNYPIEFQDMNWRGLITFRVPHGIHNIKIQFTDSKIRLFANILSITSILGLLIYLMIKYNFRHVTQK